jgi:CBS domain-containing protein
MKIRDVMSHDVCIARPNDTIAQVAAQMAQLDVGVLPVGENDRLAGMITDRDIVVRGVAKSCDPTTTVREIMSGEVKYCYEDESVGDVAENMAEQRVRRLPVLNRDKRLVGIVSLGDLATHVKPKTSGDALRGVSQPGGPHSQGGATEQAPAPAMEH